MRMKSKPTNITSEGTSKKLVPELRFPEFKNQREWDVVILGKVFERITDKNRENCQNVVTISAQNGLVSQLEFFNKSVAASNVTNYYIIKNGDFAYNKSRSEGYPYGAIKQLRYYDKGVVSTLYICFRLIDKIDNNDFYAQYFETSLINSEIGKLAQEGARNHGLLNISADDFFDKISLYIPSQFEQQKIAQCLSSIDELIAATKDKVEQLKEHKSGLMQKLFPAKGKTHPMLRFPMLNNDEEWEEIELKDACHMQAGKFISAAEISERGLYPCYGGNGMRGKTNEYNYSGKHPIIGRQGALCGNVCLVDGKFYATEHAVVVTPKNEYDSTFLYYILCYLNLNQYATGQAQPGLAVDSILKIKCTILHDLDEQNKITSILSSLDDMIIQYTEKVKTLELHKKGLMQKLFPKK